MLGNALPGVFGNSSVSRLAEDSSGAGSVGTAVGTVGPAVETVVETIAYL